MKFKSFVFEGQIALPNQDVLLVANSVKSYMDCSKFLEENIHIAEVNTPTGVKETEISKISLTTKLKSLDMKWLGFDCKVNILQYRNAYLCFSKHV